MIAPSKKFFLILTLAWGLVVVAGVKLLFDYAAAPGASGNPPTIWPVGSAVPAPQQVPVLIMIAHPHCPCTRASLSELSKFMSKEQGKVLTYVLVYSPRQYSSGWTKSDLWYSAERIPGVTVLPDPEGVEAHRFEVVTSGHTLLYGPDGRLRFSGGITSARGHEGDNQGVDLIRANLDKMVEARRSTPVFGCPVVVHANGRI